MEQAKVARYFAAGLNFPAKAQVESEEERKD